MPEIVLVRHGETAWSHTGQHTGRTDLPLTAYGERQASALRPLLARRRFAVVLASPLRRAWRTAELAGLPDPRPEPDLMEWDYGGYNGRTIAQIRAERPGWFLWRDGVPRGTTPGERASDVGDRADRVLARVGAVLSDDGGERADVALVAHGHLLRVVAARWLGLPAERGGSLALATSAVCVLGTEHGAPVLARWNLPNPLDAEAAP